MVDNNENGKSVADQTSSNESKAVEQNPQEKTAEPKDAFIGVDGEGYFFARIHMTQHPWTVIGFLNDAIAQYRGMVVKRQKDLEAQRQKLMGRSKTFLNLLRPK